MNEHEKCIKLIENNGGKLIDKDEEYDYYDFKGYGIDINKKEIVFIDECGDFAEINCNYYELVGFLFEWHMIDIGYKSIRTNL